MDQVIMTREDFEYIVRGLGLALELREHALGLGPDNEIAGERAQQFISHYRPLHGVLVQLLSECPPDGNIVVRWIPTEELLG